MIRYCEDRSTCRRELQLHYLGETDFDPSLCAQTCENFRRNEQYLLYECVTEGKALARLVLSGEQCQLSLSKKQLIDVIRGRGDKNLRTKLERLERAGADLGAVKALFSRGRQHKLRH